MLAMDYVLFFTEVFHYNNVSSSKKNAFLKMKIGVFTLGSPKHFLLLTKIDGDMTCSSMVKCTERHYDILKWTLAYEGAVRWRSSR